MWRQVTPCLVWNKTLGWLQAFQQTCCWSWQWRFTRLVMIIVTNVFIAKISMASTTRLATGMRPLDRYLVGVARDYVPDETPIDTTPMRPMAWRAMAKLVSPVPLARARDDSPPLSLPRFLTWYDRQEILVIFRKLWEDLPSQERSTRQGFSEAEIAAAWQWHATRVTELPGWDSRATTQRLTQLYQDPEGLGLLHADTRVLYSPGFVRHALKHFRQITNCLGPQGGDFPAMMELPAGIRTPCLREEFPRDAAVVKMRWMPLDEDFVHHDTAAIALAKTISAGTWQGRAPSQLPNASEIYRRHAGDDGFYGLVGLHLAAKELPDWLWVTAWWSEASQAHQDFGEDRPAATILPGVWQHYKLCHVRDFRVRDEERGHLAGFPSLKAAMHSSWDTVDDDSSWCSNPYIEVDSGNAATNCIGCHQHAGTYLSTEQILNDDQTFPGGSRHKVRNNFPADYLWSFRGNETLAYGFAEIIATSVVITHQNGGVCFPIKACSATGCLSRRPRQLHPLP